MRWELHNFEMTISFSSGQWGYVFAVVVFIYADTYSLTSMQHGPLCNAAIYDVTVASVGYKLKFRTPDIRPTRELWNVFFFTILEKNVQ